METVYLDFKLRLFKQNAVCGRRKYAIDFSVIKARLSSASHDILRSSDHASGITDISVSSSLSFFPHNTARVLVCVCRLKTKIPKRKCTNLFR